MLTGSMASWMALTLFYSGFDVVRTIGAPPGILLVGDVLTFVPATLGYVISLALFRRYRWFSVWPYLALGGIGGSLYGLLLSGGDPG